MSDPAAANAVTEAPAPSGRRGGRGCLWSCGGCLILLLLLAALVGLGWWRYGSPWMEDQKRRLADRFPAAASLLHLKERLPLEGLTVAGGPTGSSNTAEFPRDVFLPTGSRDATFEVTASQALAVASYRKLPVAQIADSIRTEMRQLGWTRTPIPDVSDAVRLRFTLDGREALYEIVPLDSGSELWIRVVAK